MKPPLQLVLLRHGQSLWNRQRRFTGWADIELSNTGERQAHAAGELLAAAGFRFDEVYVSPLVRATTTLEIALRAMRCGDIRVKRDWRLIERHYGALEGMGPLSAVFKFGLWQVIQCQRQVDFSPPPLDLDDPRLLGNQKRFAEIAAADLPRAESRQQTSQRVRPVWEEHIAPAVKAGRRLLVVSHKNTLRELIKHIVNHAGSRAAELSIRTGQPMVYEFNADLEILANYAIK